MLLAFVDTETTGLDPDQHEVIEVAIILVQDGKTLHTLHRKIKPQHLELADKKALEINGYAANPDAWALALPMREVGPDIVSLLQGAVLVGHNVGFDEVFLRQNLARAGVKGKVPFHKIDTVTLAFEHLHPLGLKRVALDSIRDFLGWTKEGAHTALKDTEDTKKLFDLLWGMTFFRKQALRFKLWKLRTITRLLTKVKGGV